MIFRAIEEVLACAGARLGQQDRYRYACSHRGQCLAAFVLSRCKVAYISTNSGGTH